VHSIVPIIRYIYANSLSDVTYLDHAGATLYADSLIHRISEDMRSNLFGNPHSASPSSELSTQRVEDVRSKVLRFFKADPEDFDLVFVANATAAIKIVVDAFRDAGPPGLWYGYHKDSHTSLVGIRQVAAQSRCFVSDKDVEDWLDEEYVTQPDTQPVTQPGESFTASLSLFAYPAQSNMNGHRLPMDWAGRVRKSFYAEHQKIYTLLDAAAYAMTAQLDLSDVQSAPDFIALSFQKIFGFPDLGALIVRKAAGDVLRQRRYFGGGTVDMVTVMNNPWHAKKTQTLHEQLEDGTLPFHSIIALDSALSVHAELYGSMENISRHTCALALNLYTRLAHLRHANGQAVSEMYKDPDSQYGNVKTQGPTIAFNLRNAQGGWIGKSDVERFAIARNIHLRTGGVCNPGGIATFCKLAYWEMRRNYTEGMRWDDDLDILGGKPTGVVRVSLGAMSSQEDVDRFISFVEDMFVETEEIVIPAPITLQVSPVDRKFTIENLQIFPVLGCSGWQVPEQTSWPFGKTGLAWDGEWCVVPQDGRLPLDPEFHLRMSNIRPYLDIKKGILRLVAPTVVPDITYSYTETASDVSDLTTEYEELTISLWESPPSADRPSESEHRSADPYHSADFFTRVLGVASTLARSQDYRKFAKALEQDHAYSGLERSFLNGSLQPIDRSITIAGPTQRKSYANLTLSQPRRWQHAQHIRIGQHSFQILDAKAGTPADMKRLLYIPNPYDHSLSSQYPTIAAGDQVHILSAENGTSDLDLRARILPTNIQAYTCPFWNCRKEFAFPEDLAWHMHDHGTKSRSRTPDGITAMTRVTSTKTRDIKAKVVEFEVDPMQMISKRISVAVATEPETLARSASTSGNMRKKGKNDHAIRSKLKTMFIRQYDE
jgi:molybdenum cofactor sulfurtransferase